jgi:serine/threonine protein kinase
MELTPRNPAELNLRLGKRALDKGFITLEQLKTAILVQARDPFPESGSTPRLGVILHEKGYITSTQLQTLIMEERHADALGTFGKFSLLREVGSGGMGVVYEARDLNLDRRVALKLLLVSPNAGQAEAALDEERFVREAQLSAKLKHPHIVSVYEAGTINARRYIAMEFVEGKPMREWRRTGSLTIRQLISILRDIALALHHAHENGVIHRDLKPENVIIDRNNEPHITDFGLAKYVGQNVMQSFSAEGRVVGTPAYMSPEQVQGSKSIDARTDVYSLGVMLYEILTGKLPFRGDSAMEIMMQAVNSRATPPSKVSGIQMNAAVFGTLESICLRAMAREPGDRYDNARQMAEDLSAWLQGQRVRVGSPRLRRKILWIAAAGLIATATAWAAMRPWSTPPAPPPAPVAATPARASVVWQAGRTDESSGLRLRTSEQHECLIEPFQGKMAARPFREGRPGFLYLDIDDAWAAKTVTAEVEIEYFDAGPSWSNFVIEFDSMDVRWPQDGTYKRGGMVVLEGTRTWRKYRCVLTCPRFENRMDLGADLRVATDRAEIVIHRIEVRPWKSDPVILSVPAPVDGKQLRPGLQAEYHAGIHLADLQKKGVDLDLVFDWPREAWVGGPADRFSIRWTGGLRIPRKGRYVVDVQSDDGVRLFLGGRPVISDWRPRVPQTDAALVLLDPGFYPVQLDFFEEGGAAYLRVALFEERDGRMWPIDPLPLFHLGK